MTGQNELSLSITRLIVAPRPIVYRAWTEHLSEWWAPKPHTTPEVEIDLRPGGIFRAVMMDGDGNLHPETDPGVVLDVVPNERVVFTDALHPGWIPSATPFFVAVFTFADEVGQTRYTAEARHWRKEDQLTHEQMGFKEGWGLVAEQLEAVARRLAN